jgi:hypothetical protein
VLICERKQGKVTKGGLKTFVLGLSMVLASTTTSFYRPEFDEINTIYRAMTGDGGYSWVRIDDSERQLGGSAISGDSRVNGRVYLGACGRGIVFGSRWQTRVERSRRSHAATNGLSSLSPLVAALGNSFSIMYRRIA